MIFGNMKDGTSRVSRARMIYRDIFDKLNTSGYFKRLYKNKRMFSGLNGGQYHEETYKELISMGVPPVQINYVMKEVRLKIGQMLENPISISYESRETSNSDELNVIQNLFDYNFNRGSWKDELFQISKDGLLLSGFGKFFVDFSNDSKLGDFGFRRVSPSLMCPDPDWISNDFNDCSKLVEFHWKDPYEIENIYGSSSPELKIAQKLYDGIGNSKNSVGLYEELEKGISQEVDYQSGKFRVVEIHYMETIKKSKVVNKETKESIPLENFSEEELESIKQFGEKYGVEEEMFEANKTFIFVPFFDNLVLFDDLYPIQCGSLPYTHFSYSLLDGQAQGLVDLIEGIQMNINKRESSITHTLATSSNNNYLLEEGAFPNENAKKNFKANMSRGGNAFDVTSGANTESKISLLAKGQPPNDMMRAVDRSVDQMKDISNSTNAVQGKGEGRESAVLYRNKIDQALTADAETIMIWEKLHKKIAEVFYSNLRIYSDAPRKLSMPDGRKVALNERVYDEESGDIVIINDIAKLPRYTFNIQKSKLGTARRQEDVALNMELRKGTTIPTMQSFYELEIINNLDVSEEFKRKAKAYIEAFIEFQLAQMGSQTASFTLSKIQAEQQIQQLQNPQPPAPNPNEVFGGMASGGEQSQEVPQDTRQIAKGPGMGEVVGGAGIAGKQTASNNFGNSPSDMTNR